MPTPTTAFADVAAKYGGVDPNDIGAVQEWFAHQLSTLPPHIIEQVLEDLLVRDGEPLDRMISPSYPMRARLPSLAASPAVASPLLAGDLKRLVVRIIRTRRGRGS